MYDNLCVHLFFVVTSVLLFAVPLAILKLPC
jgi:hypothetical protein